MWCFSVVAAVCAALILPMDVHADELPLHAVAAVLMDADTGRVLYDKNGEEFLSNASTTKILTCILALENAEPDEIVEASSYAAGMPKVKLFMNPGEHFRLEDLLYSLMLESHNDSAVAIAEHVGGSMEGFAAMMNEKAERIGCENSFFITPNGLDATRTVEGPDGVSAERAHGTTAKDLALIMSYCAFYSPARERFLEITRTPDYCFTSQEGRNFSCANRNAFLSMMDGALTGKTGFTNKAGYCYVGALERDGKRFAVALLGCGWPNHKTWKWEDAKELFTYGLTNYEYHRLDEARVDGRAFLPLPVQNGQSQRLGQGVSVSLRPGARRDLCRDGLEGMLLAQGERIEVEYEVRDGLTAPVEEGLVVGCVRYSLGDDVLREVDIVTASQVPEIDFKWCFLKVAELFFP